MQTGLFDIVDVAAWLEPGEHRHEVVHAAAIEADWARRRAANPRLFNGRTILGTRWQVSEDRLSITCREVGYASLLHWLDMYGRAHEEKARDLRPPGGDIHFFANAVIVGSDGRVIMGRMAPHTYNAGHVYMPSGSFDPDDFDVGGVADFAGNMRREVLEETGLDLGEAEGEPGHRVYFGGNYLATFRVYRFRQASVRLIERAKSHLAGGEDELSNVLAVAPGETDAAMPRHVRAFMEAFTG